MRLIPLSQQGKNKGKFFAQVDDEDYDFLMQWKWKVIKSNNTHYALRIVKKKGKYVESIRMHRIIMQTPRELVVDHDDHNGLNNQKYNMKNCTNEINMTNQLPKSSKKIPGIIEYNNW